MDQDIALSEERPVGPLPRRTVEAGPLTSSAEPTIIDPAEHNIVFTSLVTGDQDVVGLVAYSIYKQNKYDWLMAFSRTKGRMPDESEAQSYLLGESTTRRLATYRHLAEATLEGRGIEVPGNGPRPSPRPGAARGEAEAGRMGLPLNRLVLIGIIAVILAVLGLLWLLHGGPAPVAK